MLNSFLPKSSRRYVSQLECGDEFKGDSFKRLIDDLFLEYGFAQTSHPRVKKGFLEQGYTSEHGSITGNYYCDSSPVKVKEGIDAKFMYVGVDKAVVERIEDAILCTGCVKTK